MWKKMKSKEWHPAVAWGVLILGTLTFILPLTLEFLAGELVLDFDWGHIVILGVAIALLIASVISGR